MSQPATTAPVGLAKALTLTDAVLLLVGGVIGLAGAIGLGRAARSLLFELQGHDPVVIVIAR